MLADAQIRIDDGRAGSDAADPADHAGVSGVESILQVLHQCARVQPALSRPDGKQGFQLRRKEEAIGQLRIVERLDAETVAREYELAPPLIVQTEGKHAVE